MVRIILEDIKKNKIKKAIIPKKREEVSFEPAPLPTPIPTKPLKIKVHKEKRPFVFNKLIVVIFFVAIILGGGYWGLEFFKKVDITIIPKTKMVVYKNKPFVASKDLTSNAVNFELMITSDKKTKNIILTEAKEVSIKAEGSITLYNEFSTKTEKLSAGTFVSDNTGKTYKIKNAVSIPGYKTENKKVIPGQIVADIVSFLPGEVYNGSPTDFSINSFKGTSKYNKIYGKLKSPLVGGAVGLMYVLDDSNKGDIDNIAENSLKLELLEKVKSLIPPGYILYPSAVNFSYKTAGGVLSKTPEAQIEIEGTLSALLFEEKSLKNDIVKVSLPPVSEAELKEIEILGLEKLSFSFANKDQLITKDTTVAPFTLSGNINFIWNPDLETLKTKLVGVNKNNILSIFKEDPGIESGSVKFLPPWQKYIPDDLSRINIKSK